MFSRTCLANVSRHEEGEIVNVKIWRRNCRRSVTGMNAQLTNGLLMLVLAIVATMRDDATVLGYSGAPLVMDQDIPLRTCRYSRIHSMIQVRCANLGLERIPSNLKTEIQVRERFFFFLHSSRSFFNRISNSLFPFLFLSLSPLDQILDMSVNRVRVLTNDSLAPYTNLAYLYLRDNFIQEIQEGAFDNLRYLKMLDLSTNGCDILPKSLFRLPYLQNLYLSKNRLGDELFERVDVKSPLILLQLSKNRLGRIPLLGPVPTLTYLNVSDNNIGSVSPEDLAPFCSLKKLDLSKNPIKFDAGSCECHTFNAWLHAREIVSRPVYNCSEERAKEGCARQEFTNRTMELHERCTEILRLQAETEKARNTWILIACCISGFLFCLFVGLFCVHKKNKRRRKKLKEEQKLNANNANTELLNSNLNQPENTWNMGGMCGDSVRTEIPTRRFPLLCSIRRRTEWKRARTLERRGWCFVRFLEKTDPFLFSSVTHHWWFCNRRKNEEKPPKRGGFAFFVETDTKKFHSARICKKIRYFCDNFSVVRILGRNAESF